MGQLVKFNLESLAQIDGRRVAIAFDNALKRIAADCEDRPADKKARKVILQVEIVPVCDIESGICDSVETIVQIKDSVPTRKTAPYDFVLKKGGFMAFNEDSLSNAKQATFDMDEDD